MLIAYAAAGLDPAAFWSLTFRTFDLHMQGAAQRIQREIEISNRQAHNTAALVGGAFAGKLPSYDKAFGKKIGHGVKQSVDVLEAKLRELAAAWGAETVG